MIESKERSKIFQENCELITENINELIIIINQVGEIESINNLPLIKSLGYESDDIIGKSWLNYVHSEDLETAINVLENCTEGKPVVQELRLKHANGSYKNFKFFCKLTKNFNESNGFLIFLRPEQRLKESNEFYKTILDCVINGVWVTNKDDIIFFTNKGMETIAGIAAAQIVDVRVLKDFPESTLKYFRSYYLKAKEALEPVYYNAVPVKTPGGRQSYQSGWLIPRTQDGKYDGMICTVEDVTERIEYEQELKESKVQLGKFNKELEQKVEERTSALKESEEKYRMLIDSISDVIFEIDLDGKIIYLSPQTTYMLGYRPEHLINKNSFTFIHPDDQEKVLEHHNYIINSGGIGSVEFRIRHKKGYFISVSSRGQLTKKDNEKRIVGSFRDITECNKIKEKVQLEREKAELYLNLVNVLIVALDRDGHISMINQKGREILGWNEGELIGKNWFENCLPLVDRDKVYSYYNQLMKGTIGVKPFYENSVITKNGEERLIAWSTILVRDSNGNITGALSSGEDITEREKAEQELRKSEERLKYLASSGPTVIYTAKASGDYGRTFFSENVKDLTGCDPDDFINNSELWINNIHPEDKDLVLSRLSKISKKKSIGYEYRFKFKNETYHWIRDESKLITDDKGNPVELIGFWSDITWSKKSEEKIQYQAKLVENVSDAIISTDLDFKIITWNKAAESIYGWKADETIGKYIIDIIPTEYSNGDTRTVTKQLLEEGFWNGEVIQPHKDGTQINILESVSILKDLTGNPIGVIAINHNITERKKAEQKLKESEEKFRTIAEQSSLGMIIQQDGLIKFANSAVSDIIEYQLEDIHKWTAEDTLKFIYKEDLQLIIEKLKQRQDGDFESINQYECRAITKSEKIKWIDVYTKPIIYQGKNAVLSTFIDITEKKKVEEELKEISRLKSELLSRTSHELKTPLVSIKGYADLLLSQHYEELDFYTISVLHEIKQGCSRLESLIKDLLETSKLESGEIELNKAEDDLAFLIRFCVRDLKGLVETRNHELILDIKNKMITYFEKEKIYEVLMNLISNAIKYTPTNGKIILSSKVQNGNYVISVQDTGIGLTDEEKAKIFKKFGKIERYGKGLDVVSEGSGLGLYISKKIIELHKGNIWVESEGRKKGSIFYFSLPIINN